MVQYDKGSLPAVLPRPIRVEGCTHVWVLPRAVPGDKAIELTVPSLQLWGMVELRP